MSDPIDYTETGARLRVLWNRGRQMYSTFFSELATVRQQIGDDKRFVDWCFYDLKVSITNLQNVSAVLQTADAKRVKEELLAAKRLAAAETKAAKDADRAEKKRQRDAKSAADAADAKRAKSREYQRARRAKQKAEGAAKSVRISEDPVLADWIEQSIKIDKTSRTECGRLYSQMRDRVKEGAAKDEFGKKWKWQRWATLHIPRSISDINRCIVNFSASMRQNLQNVFSIVKND